MTVIRMGYMAMRVPDLDAAVAFHRDVLGMLETERSGGVSYLTCNERHHELMLIQDPDQRGYHHIALEVENADALNATMAKVRAAGGQVLGGSYEGEPGIDRAARVVGPGGHVFKLFCGMETVAAPPPADRPLKFEHASVKAWNMKALERFLEDGPRLRLQRPDGGGPPAGGTATRTTTAWRSCARRAASCRTTRSRCRTSTRWGAAPTASSCTATSG